MDFGSVVDHVDQIVIASKIGSALLKFVGEIVPLVGQLLS